MCRQGKQGKKERFRKLSSLHKTSGFSVSDVNYLIAKCAYAGGSEWLCSASGWARIHPVHTSENFQWAEKQSYVLLQQKLICGTSAIVLYLSAILTLWFSVARYQSSVWKFQSHHWSLLQQHNADKQLMERKVLLPCCSLLLGCVGLQLLYFSDSMCYWILEQSFTRYEVRHYFVICMPDTERTIILYCKLPTAGINWAIHTNIKLLFCYWIHTVFISWPNLHLVDFKRFSCANCYLEFQDFVPYICKILLILNPYWGLLLSGTRNVA